MAWVYCLDFDNSLVDPGVQGVDNVVLDFVHAQCYMVTLLELLTLLYTYSILYLLQIKEQLQSSGNSDSFLNDLNFPQSVEVLQKYLLI